MADTPPNVTNAFNAAAQVRPEILEPHLVAGDCDGLIKSRIAGMRRTANSSAR